MSPVESCWSKVVSCSDAADVRGMCTVTSRFTVPMLAAIGPPAHLCGCRQPSASSWKIYDNIMSDRRSLLAQTERTEDYIYIQTVRIETSEVDQI